MLVQTLSGAGINGIIIIIIINSTTHAKQPCKVRNQPNKGMCCKSSQVQQRVKLLVTMVCDG